MARAMEITTPLGPEVLLFHGMHAREELSRVSEFQLDLLSLKHDIRLDDILGKNVTVTLALQDDSPRHFNGYVTRFSQGATYGKYRRYHATVHPWLWFLSRTSDCRIFQEMTVPDIVKKVFADHPTSKIKDELTGSYATWNYCVQYRETDLNFVSRLLEHEGIYFYFTHVEGHHTLVLADSYSAHEKCCDDPVPFIAPEDLSRPDIERINTWTLTREVQPGVYVHDDYDFERPSVDLQTKKVTVRHYTPSDYEMYDYPGEYLQKGDGEASAAVRIDEFAAQFEVAHGSANVKALSVGGLFELEKHQRDDQNAEYLVVSATYDAEFSGYEAVPEHGGSEYSCRFVAMSSKQQFRPKRLTAKPSVQGPQTAVVVGPGGEEIYTDKFSRVKVQFHWDRRGRKDENSSCWVRVSQPWAGTAWGGIAIPRIGQEVIIDFLEGDPDQPIITGRVYNAEQMPPYALPQNMTQTGIKSRSTKGGGPDNFNEIRFEDLKGSEQLFIHAEKNQDIEVENDETHWVGHDRKKTIDNDETTLVQGNRTETVKKDESITINGDRTEKVDKNETIAIKKDRSESVGDNETVLIGKDQKLTVDGSRTREVAKDETVTIEGGQTLKVEKDRKTDIGQNDTVKVGKNLVLDAGDQVTIQTGSASIVMKKDGTITIKGKDISLDGSGKISIKASGDVVVKGSKVTQN